jgi:hypothetical protein
MCIRQLFKDLPACAPVRLLSWLGLSMAGLMFSISTYADVLEEMETRAEQGVGEIRLLFSVPVRYLKHFPAEHGELLKVYLQTVGLDQPTGEELRGYKRSPAMPLVPSYSVTYTTARNCYAALEPLCLDIQFSQPVQYRLRPGEDGRSLLIYILPGTDKPITPAKP